MGMFFRKQTDEMDKFLKKYLNEDILSSGKNNENEKTKVEKEVEKISEVLKEKEEK